MKIYISTSCLKDGSDLAKTLALYHKHEIKNVELGSSHQYLSNLDILSTYHFSYLIHNYFPPAASPVVLNLASQNSSILNQSLDIAKKSILLTQKLKSPIYSVHPGYRQDPSLNFVFSPHRAITAYEQAFKTFITSVKNLSDFAYKHSVRLLVENNIIYTQEYGDISRFCILYRDDEFERLFRQINYPHLGMLLDLGHLQVNAYWQKYNKENFVDKLKNKIMAIHIHDNDSTTDSHLGLKSTSWPVCVAKKSFIKSLPVIFEARNLSIDEIIRNKKLLEDI